MHLLLGMVLIALFLVNSTIRLTVATRGEEISIMKYVGGLRCAAFLPKPKHLPCSHRYAERLQLPTLLPYFFGSNPLPDAYHIKLEQMEQMEDAVAYLSNTELFPQIELVRYGQDVVDKIAAQCA